MKEFILGFISGMVSLLVILPLMSKLLMKWFVKKKMNQFSGVVSDKLVGLTNKFPQMQNGGKENDKTGKRWKADKWWSCQTIDQLRV